MTTVCLLSSSTVQILRLSGCTAAEKQHVGRQYLEEQAGSEALDLHCMRRCVTAARLLSSSIVQVLRLSGYTAVEKQHIGQQYLEKQAGSVADRPAAVCCTPDLAHSGLK